MTFYGFRTARRMRTLRVGMLVSGGALRDALRCQKGLIARFRTRAFRGATRTFAPFLWVELLRVVASRA